MDGKTDCVLILMGLFSLSIWFEPLKSSFDLFIFICLFFLVFAIYAIKLGHINKFGMSSRIYIMSNV